MTGGRGCSAWIAWTVPSAKDLTKDIMASIFWLKEVSSDRNLLSVSCCNLVTGVGGTGGMDALGLSGVTNMSKGTSIVNSGG